MGAAQGYNRNPLVGQSSRDTLENCLVMLEYLQMNSEDQHAGAAMSVTMVRDALGHTLQQEAAMSGRRGGDSPVQ